jgi:protein involved in polysaccharide export with SLBB domain
VPEAFTLAGEDAGAVVPLPLQDQSVREWVRPLHPESNSTFINIDGTPYYRLGPGDELSLTLYLNGDITTFQLIIEPGGEIRFPGSILEESVRIAGLALPQARARLSEALSEVLRRPDPVLRVTSYNSARATLVGEIMSRDADTVSSEGLHPLTGRTTLLHFIMSHASFTDMSDLSAIIVTDSEGRTGMFDLSAALYGTDQSHNPVLDDGDVVFVPSLTETRSQVFVLGDVVRQSLVPPSQGMTLLKAIMEAGGPRPELRYPQVTLVRGRGRDAELFRTRYNRMARSGDVARDILLQPGDIVFVGNSTYDTALEFFRDTWSVLQTAVVVSILVGR